MASTAHGGWMRMVLAVQSLDKDVRKPGSIINRHGSDH